MTPSDQARRYVAKCPPAISGAEGHATAYDVVCQVVNGFALGEAEAMSVLADWNRTCQPPWSDRDLRHKINDAITKPHNKPRGHKLGKKQPMRFASVEGIRIGPTGIPRAPSPAPAATPKPKAARIEITEADLPEEIQDGARLYLQTLFRDGDGVRIVNARWDEDHAKEVPDGAGPSLPLAEWLRKLDKVKGNPNAIWSSGKKLGIYIAINPYKVGATRDDDVTDFRHCLVEFDGKSGLSPEAQWSLYAHLKLPCAAITFSGGESVHAVVRVDASSRAEFDERVKVIYEYLSEYNPDPANKNPGRLSRLPFCVRGEQRQQLLAVNTGPASYTEWIKAMEGDALGPCETFASLWSLDTDHDPNCLLGFRRDGTTSRYLCKGMSAWVLGPSGIGKSSLTSDAAIAFALGKPWNGVVPARPLKSLIIQAENDRYDLAEMVKGIGLAHGLVPGCPEWAQVMANVQFKTETRCVGQSFADRLHRLSDRDRPDLVWCDPMMSFMGVDVSKQSEVTMFLRQMITPVLESTGICLLGIHHTGKPKSAKETASWTAIDWAYAGLGSSELVNWARAVMFLRPVGDGVFELKLAKRGGRAGARHPDGEPTSSIWLKHAAVGIRWEQIAPPAEPEQGEGNQSKPEPASGDFVALVPVEGGILKSLLIEDARAKGFSARGAIAMLQRLLSAKTPSIKSEMVKQEKKRAVEMILRTS